jgi:hypothetical protein
LGGVLVIKYQFNESKFETIKLKNRNLNSLNFSKIDSLQRHFNKNEIDLECYQSIYENYIQIKKDLDLALDGYVAILGEVFADIKGYAEVRIFGITLAGVYLHAYARMRICGDTQDGITHIGGAFGAEFCVKIGCVTFCKSAEIHVTLISGTCKAESFNYQYLPQNK